MTDPIKWFERLFLKGKSLDDMMLEHAVKRWKASWSEQSREEQRRRMHYVLAMAAELAEIRKTDNFSTAFCEMAIEDVICGKWDDVSMHAGFFNFDLEGPELRAIYEPKFAKFKKLCEEAVLTSTPNKEMA